MYVLCESYNRQEELFVVGYNMQEMLIYAKMARTAKKRLILRGLRGVI